MKKRMLSFASLLLCALLALSACGQTQSSSSSAAGGNSGSAGASSQAASQSTAPGTFPITAEKTELDIFFTRDTPPANWDVETNWFTEYYEELTNIHVNFEMVVGDPAQRAQAVNLKLASAQYPDIFSKCMLSRSQQVMYGTNGVFIPLNDLIDQYAPNIKKMFDDNPHIREQITAPDGNIYGLPDVVYFVHGTSPSKMWMNGKWLEQLDIEAPATTEEFYDALVAIRDGDPNGNGLKDEVPLVTQGLDIAFLMNSFVYFDMVNNRPSFTMLDGDEIKFVGAMDEYREGLRYIAKLVNEGLYAADSLTMDRNQRTALAMGDPEVVGAGTALWPGHFLTVDTPVYSEDSRFWEYQAISPLEGPAGLRQAYYAGAAILNGGSEFAITSACEDPVAAIRWIDYFYNLEGFNTASYGPKIADEAELIEGIAGWREAIDGEVGADGNPALFFPYGLNNEVNVGWQTGQVVPRYQSYAQHTGMAVPADGHYEQMLYDVTVNDYWPYKADKTVPPLYMDDQVSSEFAELNAILQDYATEAAAQFITGVRDLETEWDAYLSELNSLGLARFMEVYQQEYEKNYK